MTVVQTPVCMGSVWMESTLIHALVHQVTMGQTVTIVGLHTPFTFVSRSAFVSRSKFNTRSVHVVDTFT
jgi:hypothetical protein